MAVPVATVDPDQDTYPNYFEATFSTTAPAGELEFYITEADRLSAPVGRRWQVKAAATQLTGNVRFRGGPWQLVRPELIQQAMPDGVDPAEDCNYVQQLEVWRRRFVADGTTADTASVVYEYESHPCSCGCVNVGDPARERVFDRQHGAVGALLAHRIERGFEGRARERIVRWPRWDAGTLLPSGHVDGDTRAGLRSRRFCSRSVRARTRQIGHPRRHHPRNAIGSPKSGARPRRSIPRWKSRL